MIKKEELEQILPIANRLDIIPECLYGHCDPTKIFRGNKGNKFLPSLRLPSSINFIATFRVFVSILGICCVTGNIIQCLAPLDKELGEGFDTYPLPILIT